jgi:hypothetical protein
MCITTFRNMHALVFMIYVELCMHYFLMEKKLKENSSMGGMHGCSTILMVCPFGFNFDGFSIWFP